MAPKLADGHVLAWVLGCYIYIYLSLSLSLSLTHTLYTFIYMHVSMKIGKVKEENSAQKVRKIWDLAIHGDEMVD